MGGRAPEGISRRRAALGGRKPVCEGDKCPPRSRCCRAGRSWRGPARNVNAITPPAFDVFPCSPPHQHGFDVS